MPTPRSPGPPAPAAQVPLPPQGTDSTTVKLHCPGADAPLLPGPGELPAVEGSQFRVAELGPAAQPVSKPEAQPVGNPVAQPTNAGTSAASRSSRAAPAADPSGSTSSAALAGNGASNPSDSGSSEDSGLPIAAIVGIAAGGGGVLLALAGVGVAALRRRHKRKASSAVPLPLAHNPLYAASPMLPGEASREPSATSAAWHSVASCEWMGEGAGLHGYAAAARERGARRPCRQGGGAALTPVHHLVLCAAPDKQSSPKSSRSSHSSDGSPAATCRSVELAGPDDLA